MGNQINSIPGNASWTEPDNKGRIAKGVLAFDNIITTDQKKIIACAFARIFEISSD